MHPLSYRAVYDAAYRAGMQGVDAWVRKGARRLRTHRARLHWTRYVLTFAHSQGLGQHVTSHTLDTVAHMHRLAELGALMRLRLLQRRLLRHLWRPGGALMMRLWTQQQQLMPGLTRPCSAA
tara:strand:- start:507 stop:872 length:366 start_codon:yes stop_codon:yes gene_type:complete